MTITLGATDNFDRRIDTGPFETLYSLDAGITYQQYTEPLTISSEGTRNISFYSVDSMGISDDSWAGIDSPAQGSTCEHWAY